MPGCRDGRQAGEATSVHVRVRAREGGRQCRCGSESTQGCGCLVLVVVVGFTSFIIVAPCSAPPSRLRQAREGQTAMATATATRFSWCVPCQCVCAGISFVIATGGPRPKARKGCPLLAFFFLGVLPECWCVFFFWALEWLFFMCLCIIGNWVTGFVSR